MALPLLLALAGCDDGGGTEDAGVDTLSERKREILAGLGDTVILPTLREVVTAAEALEAAAAVHAADPTAENRAAAQDAWRATMSLWERAELMQIGPAGMSGATGVAGGQSLRDEIYSWPTTSTCRIDQETVETGYADLDAYAAELVNVRGLDALEYLLFVEGFGNSCASLSPINTEGTWAALGDDTVRARRAAFAASAATLVVRHAVTLRDAWEPTGGDFGEELRTAGTGGAVYGTAQQAMNDLAGALLYVDRGTRDMKLGEPAGIVGCTTETCFDGLELPFAGHGIQAIIENLRGLSLVYLGAASGTDGLGLDDLLVDVGMPELAAQMESAIEAAIAAMEALTSPTLRQAIETERPAVMAAFDAISVVVRLLKSDVMTVLDLEPSVNDGDND